MSTIQEKKKALNNGLYTKEYEERHVVYGKDKLGKIRRLIETVVTEDKPYDLAESKADSDKVLALLILELHDAELVSDDLASIAEAMLHGKSREETLNKMKTRFIAVDQIVTSNNLI